MTTTRDVRAAGVKVGPRTRKDMGDLVALAASMAELGLLQPIGVSNDFWLVFGERRLKAALSLGWDTIPAVVVDVPSLLAERDENEVRKDFTPSERVEIARQVEAQVGDRQGERTDKAPGEGGLVAEKPQVEPAPGEKTRDFAARKAGFGSASTYRQAEEVVANGTPELVEAMDKGELSISAAAKAAKLPKAEQKAAAKKARERKAAGGAPKAKKPKARQEEVRDRLGRVVPDRLRDVFADGAVAEVACRVEAWLKQLSSESVARAITRRAPAYPYLDATVAAGHVADAESSLAAAARDGRPRDCRPLRRG
jgi:ParB-like chromosome segregation protein Spo0J